jgi:hypothetical protein
MKKILFVITLFWALSINAEVKLGDKASFQLRYNPEIPNHSSFKTLEVIEVNKTAGTYTYKESVISNGTTLYSITHIDRLINVTSSNQNYVNCESSDIGTFENITVPAGSFLACHVSFRPIPSMEADELFFADVPFGIVKKTIIVSSASGITLDEELVSFIKN